MVNRTQLVLKDATEWLGDWHPLAEQLGSADGLVTLAFNENVTVKGKPQLKLSDGTFAPYAFGSGTNTLAFNPPKGAANAVAAVELNGGAFIASEAGTTLRPAQLTLPAKVAAN